MIDSRAFINAGCLTFKLALYLNTCVVHTTVTDRADKPTWLTKHVPYQRPLVCSWTFAASTHQFQWQAGLSRRT